jgi:uridine kinase
LVGLAGPSGAGKSVFCDKIREFMPGVCVLTMDMYNDASMLVEGNFDDPRLTDYDTVEPKPIRPQGWQDGGGSNLRL